MRKAMAMLAVMGSMPILVWAQDVAFPGSYPFTLWVDSRSRGHAEVMEPPSSAGRSSPSESVNRCRQLADGLSASRITFEEYAPALTLSIVAGPIEDIPACTATIPGGVAALYADYLRVSLEPVDFLPCPRPLLARGDSEEEVEEAARRLRARYLRLYQLMVGERPGGDESEATGRGMR